MPSPQALTCPAWQFGTYLPVPNIYQGWVVLPRCLPRARRVCKEGTDTVMLMATSSHSPSKHPLDLHQGSAWILCQQTVHRASRALGSTFETHLYGMISPWMSHPSEMLMGTPRTGTTFLSLSWVVAFGLRVSSLLLSPSPTGLCASSPPSQGFGKQEGAARCCQPVC